MSEKLKTLTFHVEVTSTRVYCATCDQHRGLFVAEHTLSAALAAIVPALQDLLSVGPAHPDPKAFEGIKIT